MRVGGARGGGEEQAGVWRKRVMLKAGMPRYGGQKDAIVGQGAGHLH
jgi:hypothetical protein